jgi:hypothetical protein
MNRRQLHRLFHRHLGIGPKLLADLERLHSSLRGVQTRYGDPLAGFSDQAHQIRNWRRRLGVTPGTLPVRFALRWRPISVQTATGTAPPSICKARPIPSRRGPFVLP